LQHYPEFLKERFQLTELPKGDQECLAAIGKKRGCLRAGGRVEIDKAAKILLAELRAGTLGRITLETPAMMEQELAELVIIREEKAARKKDRKKNWKASR